MARKTDRRLPPGVRGRPRQEISEGATVYRQRVGVAPGILARLDEMAKTERRTPTAELAMALEAYLERRSVPDPPEIDPEHGKARFQLPADLLRRLDGRFGVDHREEHLAAALEWWVK